MVLTVLSSEVKGKIEETLYYMYQMNCKANLEITPRPCLIIMVVIFSSSDLFSANITSHRTSCEKKPLSQSLLLLPIIDHSPCFKHKQVESKESAGDTNTEDVTFVVGCETSREWMVC